MTEWGVITVMITLVGFAITIIKPITGLTKSITMLDNTVQGIKENFLRLEQTLDKNTIKNTESHARIWEHNQDQDTRMDDHEKRITILEHKGESY